MDPTRRAQLLQAKLRALVGEIVPEYDAAASSQSPLLQLPYVAGTMAIDPATRHCFVLVEAVVEQREIGETDLSAKPRPPRGWLGGAVVAAVRAGATHLHVIADAGTLDGHDARRLSRVVMGSSMWAATGRNVSLVEAVPPAVQMSLGDLGPDQADFVSVITGAGATPVMEAGVLRAEVLGLEVGRVIVHEADGDGPREVNFEVGVGKHDRLAQAMMNPNAEVAVALRNAVESVLHHRHPEALPHAANTSSRSRWLRELVIADPSLVGCVGPATRLSSTVEVDLKRSGVAAARMFRHDGTSVLVGCSAGVDLDAATDLLDVRNDSDAEVILVLPIRDILPAMTTLSTSTTPAIELVPAVWFEP